MKADWWVVRHTRTGDYVTPNRKLAPGLLGAGCWDEATARGVAAVDRRHRKAMILADALRSDPAFARGSVGAAMLRDIDRSEETEERPDGYVFHDADDGVHSAVVVCDAGDTRIGELHTFGHSDELDHHPSALAHARWRLRRMLEGYGMPARTAK